MLYAMVALGVYIVFTANEKLEKVVDILVYVVSCSTIRVCLFFFLVVSTLYLIVYAKQLRTLANLAACHVSHVMAEDNLLCPNGLSEREKYIYITPSA